MCTDTSEEPAAFEILEYIYQTVWCHVPEHRNIYNDHSGNHACLYWKLKTHYNIY